MISSIYIIHYTKLIERKIHMLKEIKKWNLNSIPVYFEEDYDQEDLTNELMYENFDNVKFFSNTNRNIKLGEASLCIKYKNILNKIKNLNDDEYVLILEDDVIFKEDPIEYINKILNKCKQENIDFDCIFMGEAALRINDDRDIFFKKDHPATNGLCTVLYSVKSVKKIIDNIQKIDYPMDWYLNNLFKQLDFNVYWAKAITKHGSVLSVYDSSVNLKSSLRDRY